MWPYNTRVSGVRRIGVATLAVVTSFSFLVATGAAPAFAETGNEHFSVRMVEQEVHGYDWEQGIEVTVEIDDPGTGDNPDWTDTQLALPPEWDPATGFVQFQPFVDSFVIESDFIVTMRQTAGATTVTKTHSVTSLEVTNANETTDVVSGIGDDGALIHVSVWDEVGTWREVTVTGGEWTADFGIAGPGGGPVDIIAGTQGGASESDPDGDSTQWSWRIPDPAFSVETPQWLWSFNDGWIPGRTVTVTLDDNADLGDGFLHQQTAIVESWGPAPWDSGWNINDFAVPIAPGHYVTVDDGVEVTKTLLVVALVITAVDEAADQVSGTASPGALVEVHACEPFLCGNRSVTADGAGLWVADFSVPGAGDHEQDVIDLQTGIGGAAQIYDADGDSTHHGWQLQDPHFGVEVVNEEMWAVNWPAGATLTFQVFADDTAADLLWTDTMTVYGTPWQNTEAGYRFWSEFDVAAGQYFTVSDGVTTKDLVVSSLAVTSVDPDGDFYTGTVDPAVPADLASEVCAWARHLDDPIGGLELCDLPDPVTGEWIIDFAGVGDIIPGDHLGANQRDPDGDETSYSWGVPPWIYVELAEQDEAGVDLYPDRVHLEQWTGPVDIYLDDVLTMSGVVTSGDYVQVDLDVTVGQTIRVVDAVDDKSLDIKLLTVDDVTAWDAPIQPSTAFGRADIPDNTRHVQVTASAAYGWWTERWVPVVGGEYQADFANPGNGWRESEIGYFGEGGADDIYLGGEVRAHLWDFDNDQVQAIWHTCNPRIIIVRGNDRIEAVCFPVGSELVIELDDPATGVGIDWDSGAPVVVTRNPDKPWETLVVFELDDYTAPDNAEVTATATEEGVPVVEVSTEVIPFTIDEIDEDADTITGTAPAGTEVLVEADGNWRYPVADGTNTWVADFSSPGDRPGEENPVDLRSGSQGGATLIDEAGSATTIAWRISNPIFNVEAGEDGLWGHDWLPNAAVTVTIGAESWTLPTDGEGNFGEGWDWGEFDLVPGMLVAVTDGDSTKSLTISQLAVTDVNPATDVISGTGTAGGFIDVWIHDTDVGYTLLVDEFGDWTVDTTADHDLVAGSNGNSSECDPDGDCIYAGWRVANPSFEVAPDSDNIWGREFLANTELTITVGGVLVPGGPYSTDEWSGFGDGWGPLPVDVAPGTAVTVSDGETTKTHLVADLAVTSVDANTDIVAGTATPNAMVQVEIHGLLTRMAAADGAGSWSVDFSDAHDLLPGEAGDAREFDADGDATIAFWRVVNPLFWVYPADESLAIADFVPDTELTITVNGNPVPGAPYVTDEWGNSGADFDRDELNLAAGDSIVISDGETTKTHSVTALAVTGADADTDEVFGVALPGSSVHVWGGAKRYVVTGSDRGDGLGEWTADFTPAGILEPGDHGTADLRPGSSGGANQCDADEDCTSAFWQVPNPAFSVETPNWVWSSNPDWELGDTITLTIDDPAFPGPLTTTVEPDGGGPDSDAWGFDLEGIFEIRPGHVVTVTDGETTKTLTVLGLIIDNVDGDSDTVSGRLLDASGDPLAGVEVEVHVDSESGGSHRTATSGPDGDWVADFGAPGEGETAEPFDITPNTGVSAQVYDGDWDSTHRGECFECDPDGYQIDPIPVEHGDVLISETDGTLWLYEPDTGNLSEHPLPFGGVWDIQWIDPDRILIANSVDARMWILVLSTGDLFPLDSELFGFPIGLALESAPGGWNPVAAWVADGGSGILRFGDGGTEVVVAKPGVDGIVRAPDGTVYFSDLSGALYVVDETEPDNYRVVVEVDGYSLNGLIMLPDGRILATSMGPSALVFIDPADGSYVVEDYPQMWSSEDSAIGRSGKVYLIDSGFETNFGDQSGLYVRLADGSLEQLISHHDVPEFGDTVDLLVAGPWVTATKEASQTEVFADGELVEFTVTVHNQFGAFGSIVLGALEDTMFGDLIALGMCTPAELASGETYECTYEALIAGDSTNTVTALWTDEWGFAGESSASAQVAMVEAAISIDKTASTAYGGPGDGVFAAPGEPVTWTYVVTNEGDVPLVDVLVGDDVLGEICLAGDLAPGDTLTCIHEGIAEPGEHANVATVTATAVDADGDIMPVAAEDGSSYIGLDHGYVTDSARCVHDAFDLVFTPDMRNWPGHYKLAASNPGQFYWNAFFAAEPGTAVELEIPYPFVTQGAMPLHSYDAVDVGDGSCFTPLGQGAPSAATFGLTDYGDTNGDGAVGYGDVHVVYVSAAGGFEYLTLHLDYGLKGTKGWTRADDGAFNDPEVNPDLAQVGIADATEHWFGVLVDGAPLGSDVIVNHNEFKNVKGFGGLVLTAGDGSAVAGAEVELRDAGGAWIETMVTDPQGWYLSAHFHKGKTSDYSLVLLSPAGAAVDEQTVTVGKAVKFGEANFFM